MPESEAQRRANLKYRKSKTRSFMLTLYPADADISEWLDRQDEKSKAVKRAIREHIESHDEG